MEEQQWDAWMHRMRAKLNASLELESSGCLIWQGALTWSKLSAPAYGVLKLPYPARHRRARTMRLKAHIVAFLLSNIHLKDLISGRRQFNLSHRCHRSRCINGDHISAEPRSVSNAGKQCKEGGSCLGHADHSLTRVVGCRAGLAGGRS